MIGDIKKFFISKHNPRKEPEIKKDPETQDLAKNLKEFGQQEDLIVRDVDGKLEIGSGARRYVASKIAGITHLNYKLFEGTEEQFLAMMHITNDQRKDPDPFKSAELVLKLGKGKTNQEVSKIMGLTASRVAQLRSIALLDKKVKSEIYGLKEFPFESIVVVAKYPKELQERFLETDFEDYLDDPEETQGWFDRQSVVEYKLKDAPFDQELTPACSDCLKRTSSQTDLFEEKEDTCLDKECFERKCSAFANIKIEEIKKSTDWEGNVFLVGKREADFPHQKVYQSLFGKVCYANRVYSCRRQTEEGAVLAIAVDNGWDHRFVHLLSPKERKAGKKPAKSMTAESTPEKKKEPTLEEKREGLKNKRFAWVIDQLIEYGNEWIEKKKYVGRPEMEPIALALAFGPVADRRFRDKSDWKMFHSLIHNDLSNINTMDGTLEDELWKRAWATLVHRVSYHTKKSALEHNDEATEIAKLIEFDIEKAKKESVQAVKEPASWKK